MKSLMKKIDQFCYRHPRFGIPNLMLYVVVGNAIVWLDNRAVKEAEAEGIRMLKDAGADDAVIRMKSLDTLAKVAEGESTKILIPSDIQNMAGLLTSLKESVK